MNIQNINIKNIAYQTITFFSSFIIVIFIFICILNLYFKNRIFPGTSVAGINLSGLNNQEALNLIIKKVILPEKLNILAKDKVFEISLNDINFAYDFDSSVGEAFEMYRENNIGNLLIYRNISFFRQINFGLKFNYDKQKLDEYLEILSSQVTVNAKYPEVNLSDGKIAINKGVEGDIVDREKFKKDFEDKMSFLNTQPLLISFTSIDPTLNEEEVNLLQKRAGALIGKQINLTFEDSSLILKDEDLVKFIDKNSDFELDKIRNYIDSNISPKINREPQNAIFSIDKEKVVEFKPAKEGVKVKTEELASLIYKNLASLENESAKSIDITINVDIAKAKITNSEVNSLGINELLGKGASKFKGSIASRIHNISLASSKINGTLIAPGETFSFNEVVGDISFYTGYKQAYIIKDGKTILGDGGGVCQVSTTVFRAALNAGLPILERHSHSYRVYYYEQDSPPGLDATVFSPTSDLKILNNTPAYILLQATVDETNRSLFMEFYGTKDLRVVTLEKPKISSPVPPPDDLYTDDPTIPTGVIKQIEYRAWGSKVSFYYKIEYNSKIMFEKTFISNYRPWQAVYLRGTGTAL
ncbi:hypothetical protein A2159_00250 [Candidatus Woesebacteria bacterium RBG_13_34_9]|uniref:YoaR-like putative peptidoglycan binding domain-containing protein n=1 Tax=Candidatus Woesebacteria bacterium RBG_13_34_9 TaxID=1802477 RepID=A0A1F7X391_9BACT|nr:MAG: hypothetical protein A2159_00250 [Candidatus Woesebacteria bacterium RBG_13_34_9]